MCFNGKDIKYKIPRMHPTCIAWGVKFLMVVSFSQHVPHKLSICFRGPPWRVCAKYWRVTCLYWCVKFRFTHQLWKRSRVPLAMRMHINVKSCYQAEGTILINRELGAQVCYSQIWTFDAQNVISWRFQNEPVKNIYVMVSMRTACCLIRMYITRRHTAYVINKQLRITYMMLLLSL